jgi:uncharacterized protein YjbI with pentapeptide repeats
MDFQVLYLQSFLFNGLAIFVVYRGNRPLNLDFKGFFWALTKASLNASLTKWDDAAKDLMDAVSAIGFEQRTPQQLAGLLLTRSISRATFGLLRDYLRDFPTELRDEFEEYCGSIEKEITELDIILDENFLERPREIALISVFQKKIIQWLVARNITEHKPESISARLPSYFVYALHQELRENNIDYTPLISLIKSSMSDAWRRERTWLAYELYFQRSLDAPVFGEGFGLKQIFIWPYAYYIRGKTNTERQIKSSIEIRDEEITPDREPEQRVALNLKETLDQWLDKGEKDDAIRIISGDPGAGKSSFVKMYAAERMERGERVLYVPLHLINVQGDLAQSIESFCAERDDCPTGLLASKTAEQWLLIVLDGLDELSKQGSIGSTIAGQFVDEIIRTVNNRNAIELRVRVLISGRPIAVQNITDKFRREAQVLHLLPYYIGKEAHEKSKKGHSIYQYVDGIELLKNDLRQEWWQKYGILKNRGYSGLPEALSKPWLDDLTSQPLLNYLVALVFEREQVDFSRDVGLNQIYAALLERVYDRDWDPAKNHRALGALKREDFRALLEEMALTAWHDHERTTTVEAVRRRFKGTYLEGVLQEYEKHCDEGVAQLFTAFYFRKSTEVIGPEPTFEFTHKSFGEYLTACRIIQTVDEIYEEFRSSDGRKRRTAGVWNEQEALLKWIEVCGPTEISRDLLPYLRNEIKLRYEDDKAIILQWQQTLARIIKEAFKNGPACERLTGGLTYVEMDVFAVNAISALLVLHGACAILTESLTSSLWPVKIAAGTWIHKLRGQRPSAGAPPVLQSLNHLDLSGQSLDCNDLAFACLNYSDLSKIEGNLLILIQASLIGSNLQTAKLFLANLMHADLEGANLEGAQLNLANLKEANLKNANLKDADLAGANLEGANFEGANLKGATLEGAKLNRAKFKDATMEEGMKSFIKNQQIKNQQIANRQIKNVRKKS